MQVEDFMGMGRGKAHQLALKWWGTQETQRSSAHCDICGAEVHRGEGYLCADKMVDNFIREETRGEKKWWQIWRRH